MPDPEYSKVPMYPGTGVIRDTDRAGFVWVVFPDLAPPPSTLLLSYLWLEDLQTFVSYFHIIDIITAVIPFQPLPEHLLPPLIQAQ